MDAVSPVFEKTRNDLPDWIDDFKFHKENELIQKRNKLNDDINSIEGKISKYKSYKDVLHKNSVQLVDSISNIFTELFKFKVDKIDDFKEDLKLLDGNSPSVLIEIKGTNGGIKREHINQVDSHRERSGFKSNFPAILIINTYIKNSQKIKDKEKNIDPEHIKHAVNMKILILRTIDLVYLINLFMEGKINSKKIFEIFKKQFGWLKVNREDYKIISGE